MLRSVKLVLAIITLSLIAGGLIFLYRDRYPQVGTEDEVKKPKIARVPDYRNTLGLETSRTKIDSVPEALTDIISKDWVINSIEQTESESGKAAYEIEAVRPDRLQNVYQSTKIALRFGQQGGWTRDVAAYSPNGLLAYIFAYKDQQKLQINISPISETQSKLHILYVVEE